MLPCAMVVTRSLPASWPAAAVVGLLSCADSTPAGTAAVSRWADRQETQALRRQDIPPRAALPWWRPGGGETVPAQPAEQVPGVDGIEVTDAGDVRGREQGMLSHRLQDRHRPGRGGQCRQGQIPVLRAAIVQRVNAILEPLPRRA